MRQSPWAAGSARCRRLVGAGRPGPHGRVLCRPSESGRGFRCRGRIRTLGMVGAPRAGCASADAPRLPLAPRPVPRTPGEAARAQAGPAPAGPSAGLLPGVPGCGIRRRCTAAGAIRDPAHPIRPGYLGRWQAQQPRLSPLPAQTSEGVGGGKGARGRGGEGARGLQKNSQGL